MSSKIADEAYVTLATTDNYAIGALTLAQSLKNVNTNRSLCIMITKEINQSLQNLLQSVFDHVEIIDTLDSNDAVNLALLKRPELGVTFTKLHCWRLVDYKKCVFLDADCLVLKNVDDLFERDEFSAAPDVGWPDCFNSGVFVFRPSLDTHSSLLSFALDHGSFDGGDQGLLNSYFNNWNISDASKRLPFIYNMTTNVSYGYAPAFKRFSDQVRIVHFIGSQKPWFYTYNTQSKHVTTYVSQHETNFVNQWWAVFTDRVYQSLSDEIKERMRTQYIQPVAYTSIQTRTEADEPKRSEHEINITQVFDTQNTTPGVVLGSNQHQNLWEQGQIDYTGRDSFSNIQAYLDSQLNKNN